MSCPDVTLKPVEVCDDLSTSWNLNTSLVESRADVVQGTPDDGNAPTRNVIHRTRVPRASLKRLQDVLQSRSWTAHGALPCSSALPRVAERLLRVPARQPVACL